MKVAIIGGGIAGLATAYYLQKQGIQYYLIDSASSFGGKIASSEENGFIIEGGPDSFITQKAAGLELCRDVGLDDELVGTNETARKVFVWSRGKLRKMPDGVMLIVPTKVTPFALSTLISWPGKIRMGFDLFLPRRKSDEDESLAHFIRRRLGHEALDKIAGPMVAGIYVADAEHLSLKSTFPRFLDIEKKHRSLLLGMLAQKRATARAKKIAASSQNKTPVSAFMTLRGGLQRLVQAIIDKLEPASLLNNCSVTAVRKDSSGFSLILNDGKIIQTDNLVFATPAYATARMLNEIDLDLSRQLAKIRYVSTATVSFGFRRSDVAHSLIGFGFVVPRSENRKIIACAWSSTKFDHRAPEGYVLVRAFVGGAQYQELAEQPEDKLLQMALGELQDALGITAQPVISKVYRWHKANPQYDVGHSEHIAEIEKLAGKHEGLYLAGAAYHGVGVPDCIADGKRVAEAIIKSAKEATPFADVGA
jgi:oxygen-dependent protoporphyrinogen oxidase